MAIYAATIGTVWLSALLLYVQDETSSINTVPCFPWTTVAYGYSVFSHRLPRKP
jgi:hypothetical protein